MNDIKSYEHKTNDQLLFDHIRHLCFEITNLSYILGTHDRSGELLPLRQRVLDSESILFDDVYIALRELWGYKT